MESRLFKTVRHGRAFFVREFSSGWCFVGEMIDDTLTWNEKVIDKDSAMRLIWKKCGGNEFEFFKSEDLELCT